MHLSLVLEMAVAGRGDDIAIAEADGRSMTTAELQEASWAAAMRFWGASAIAYVSTNGLAVPVTLFAAATLRVPFVPLNYRLAGDQLHEMIRRLDAPAVVADGPAGEALRERGHNVVDPADLLMGTPVAPPGTIGPGASDDTAVLLFTSGTTAAPKAAVLRHRHLAAYLIDTVEFGGAGDDEAVLVSVPPYHVAGLANLLSNLYAGRRIVYLRQFDAEGWISAVRTHGITQATVVPTMLARIGDALARDGDGLPTLRSLSYGGARTPAPVLRQAMQLLPEADFTNAYGLTETSSTIAVLGPEDHRAARDGDPVAVGRLSSAGQVIPSVEVEVRDGSTSVAYGEVGEVWVRGAQVSGEYVGLASHHDDDGWLPTRDRGWLDPDGYLFIEGRSDDTIIRGGENVAPAEIEDVLLQHPDIEECVVVGVPDDEWGQRIAAVIVAGDGADLGADEVREFARASLRGSKTPEVVRFVDALPYTDTGKLLRRHVQAELAATS